MNKLEEYRITQGKSAGWNEASASQIYKQGFDAAIALNLPIRFHMWTKTREYMKWVFLQSVNDEIELTELAYQYWLNYIYKPE